jgi:hypothetical protein
MAAIAILWISIQDAKTGVSGGMAKEMVMAMNL